MAVAILPLLEKFENVNDRETETAFLRTQVAVEGYLNIVYKPANPDTLLAATKKLRFPRQFGELLSTQNGAILFSGALSLYGVVSAGTLLKRDDPSSLPPYNIEDENFDWPPDDAETFLVIGGYSFDGSRVCIDRGGSRVCLFRRGEDRLLPTPVHSWQSPDEWLRSEIARLAFLFDSMGKMLVDESNTLPTAVRAS
jgi:hypothetical protein